MVEIRRGEHTVILGSTGAGKTFFARNAILPMYDRVLVLDSEEVDFDDFPKVSVDQAIRLAKSNHSFVARILLSGRPDVDGQILDKLCYGLMAVKTTMVVYDDEVTDHSDAHQIPDSLRTLIRKGRKRGISVVVGTQRPAMLSKDLYGNAQHKVFFFLSDYDADAVRSYAPFVKERMAEIPYKSYRSLYVAPDASVIVLAPAPVYNWSGRLHK